ncbi:MAG: LAGLIDADG family homing endonuclease [Gaiellaceae bacterium]
MDVRPGVYGSDNMTGADNQQERLDSYIAGYVDGEGSFSVAVQRNRTCRVGFQLVPEFHVSQNGDRAQVLGLMRDRLGCGYIKPNSKRDRALVFVVRKRKDLLERVIPFFEINPMLSSKQADFEKFAGLVRELALGHHRTDAGFRRLLELALSMNGEGRFRKVRWLELVASPESSETARQTRPQHSSMAARKIQSELHGDMQSQAEMTWPSSVSNARV